MVTLTAGATHTVSGTGTSSVATPRGLKVDLTVIPSFLGSDAGTPREYYNAGRINVGNSHGYEPHIDIVCDPQLVYPLSDAITLLAWDFAPGITAVITELLGPAPVSLAPWDRNPLWWRMGNNAAMAGPTSSIAAWTYTVPAGRRLLVKQVSMILTRSTVATTFAGAQGVISIDAVTVFKVDLRSNVVAAQDRHELLADALLLTAGQVIAASYSNGDTGGNVQADARALGLLFDA